MRQTWVTGVQINSLRTRFSFKSSSYIKASHKKAVFTGLEGRAAQAMRKYLNLVAGNGVHAIYVEAAGRYINSIQR